MNQTMVQFDPDRDHLFSSYQISALWFGPWSGGRFTPINLVRIKLKSLKVRAKQGRCERALKLARKSCTWLLWLLNKHFSEILVFIHSISVLKNERSLPCCCSHGFPPFSSFLPPRNIKTMTPNSPKSQLALFTEGLKIAYQHKAAWSHFQWPCVSNWETHFFVQQTVYENQWQNNNIYL